MRQIKILGEAINVRFNMATMLAYEEISGEAFFSQQFDTQKRRYALLQAAVITSAPDTKITPERLLNDAPWQEVIAAFTAVTEEMAEFFYIPEVMKQETDTPETSDSDGEDGAPSEKQKN